MGIISENFRQIKPEPKAFWNTEMEQLSIFKVEQHCISNIYFDSRCVQLHMGRCFNNQLERRTHHFVRDAIFRLAVVKNQLKFTEVSVKRSLSFI